jgi:hypothetical protein
VTAPLPQYPGPRARARAQRPRPASPWTWRELIGRFVLPSLGIGMVIGWFLVWPYFASGLS